MHLRLLLHLPGPCGARAALDAAYCFWALLRVRFAREDAGRADEPLRSAAFRHALRVFGFRRFPPRVSPLRIRPSSPRGGRYGAVGLVEARFPREGNT